MTADSGTNGLWYWLYTNAPAAWISALIAVITCVILVRRRTKPRRAVFREVRNSSLVRIWPGVRSKISMAFDDRPIERLGQVEGEIFNEGSETIQDPVITLKLPAKSKILEVSVLPIDPTFEAKCVIDANEAYIKIPYLNPVNDHAHVLKILLLADGETDRMSVSGSGEGWSVRFVPLINPRRDRYRLIALGCAVALGFLASYLYGAYIERHYGIGMNEVSWRSFISSLPVLVVLGACTVLFFRALAAHLDKKLRRLTGHSHWSD